MCAKRRKPVSGDGAYTGLAVSGFSAHGANRSFAGFLNDLNIRITGSGEEFAMLLNAQKRHTRERKIFFGDTGRPGIRSSIDFRDRDELSAGLQHSEDFAHVTRQVRPPEVRFHRGDQIERVRRKRQLRYRSLPDLDTCLIYPLPVDFGGHSHARPGMIDAADFSLCGGRRQLTHRSASAASHVEDGGVLFYRNVRQPPVRYFGMPRIHIPQNESAQPSFRLPAWIAPWAFDDHSWFPLPAVYVKWTCICALSFALIQFLRNRIYGCSYLSPKFSCSDRGRAGHAVDADGRCG